MSSPLLGKLSNHLQAVIVKKKKKKKYIYIYTHIYIRASHDWGLMRCDTIHPYYDAVQSDSDFDSIQHNAIRCNTMQWRKYDHF